MKKQHHFINPLHDKQAFFHAEFGYFREFGYTLSVDQNGSVEYALRQDVSTR
ncbi:MAG: hypothetical protein ONB24_04805 [candidate division KSB1 bacterium]|nr:hypothetical protein [candidate division KSB1 bacterium]